MKHYFGTQFSKPPFFDIQFFSLLFICLTFLCVMMLSLTGCQFEEEGPPKDLWEKIKGRGKLVVGVKYDSKPFGFLDTNGELKGFDIDLANKIAERLFGPEQVVEFQQVLSSTRVIALNSKNVDMVVATMTITPERKKILDFSQPYFLAGQAVMVPQESPVKFLKELNTQNILFVLGTTSEVTLKRFLPSANLLGFKTSTDAFSALKAGRGQAMTTDDTILAGFMMDQCQFRLLPQRLSKEPYGIAFRKHASTVSFRKKVDEVIAKMKSDGTLQKLADKWMNQYINTMRACDSPIP